MRLFCDITELLCCDDQSHEWAWMSQPSPKGFDHMTGRTWTKVPNHCSGFSSLRGPDSLRASWTHTKMPLSNLIWCETSVWVKTNKSDGPLVITAPWNSALLSWVLPQWERICHRCCYSCLDELNFLPSFSEMASRSLSGLTEYSMFMHRLPYKTASRHLFCLLWENYIMVVNWAWIWEATFVSLIMKL